MNNKKKVILLYGPPGVGKLTVAEELSKKTNFKLFHVHLLADLVNSLFEFGTKEFTDTFTNLWLLLFRKALSIETKGIIVTLIYGVQTLEGKNDDHFFANIIEEAKMYGADIVFIKLKCSDEELYQRVESESRSQYHKITDPETLKQLREKYKIDSSIPFTDSIEINTTNLSPTETVNQIENILNSDHL